MARGGATLTDLFHNMRYDGFPPLWYIAVWCLSRISSSPLTMQLFHFCCAAAAQFLIMTRAPFPRAMKLAVVAGYYFSFEYCVISRAYVLGVLLIVILCAFREWLTEHPWANGYLLGLLANTSVYGAILAIAFVLYDLWPLVKNGTGVDALSRHGWRGLIPYLAIFGVLLCVAVAFMIPPDDGDYFAGWDLHPALTDAFLYFSRNLFGLAPIPKPQPSFWCTLAPVMAGKGVGIPISFLVLLAVWLALRASLRQLGLFFIGFAGIWVFTVIKFFGYVRHIGHVLVLFIACLWLAALPSKGSPQSISRPARVAVWSILIANLVAMGIASYYHLNYEFSGSRAIASVIERSGRQDTPIVADIDFAASSVSGYLGRPLYYATTGKAQSFIQWNTARGEGGPDAVLSLANELYTRDKGVLLLLNYPWEGGKVRLIAQTPEAIVANEQFYLYEFAP